MRVLFCADPLSPALSDSLYAAEVAAATQAGIAHDLINLEALHDQRPTAATRRVQAADAIELAIYRGWMLRPALYTQLYDALHAKGVQLINTPAAYQHCHYLPESYPLIRAVTPETVWLHYDESWTMDRVMMLLDRFGDQPVIVKDYVKSRKHEWHEACYIPAASDRVAVERVVHRFIALQGDDLNEGLVFRAFVPFRSIGTHTKSGMPLAMEFRCFVLDGAVVSTSAYWEEGTYPTVVPPDTLFADILPQVQSRFFTMDVAQTVDGTWMIMELGDGQVAGLPDSLDPNLFYQTLAQHNLQL